MVWLWVMCAVFVVLGIGVVTNQIISNAIKSKRNEEVQCEIEDVSNDEVDQLLDAKFNKTNTKLKDFEIQIQSGKIMDKKTVIKQNLSKEKDYA